MVNEILFKTSEIINSLTVKANDTTIIGSIIVTRSMTLYSAYALIFHLSAVLSFSLRLHNCIDTY